MPRHMKAYFKTPPGAPEPVVLCQPRRVRFSEVDVMGVVWYGRYALYFEEGAAEIGRRCGLSYQDFYTARLRAPVVEYHVDYFESLYLDEDFTIKTSLVWHEGSRINTEFSLLKANGQVASSGYTVQLLTDIDGQVCLVSPPLLENCRRRWLKGEFHKLG